MVPQDERDGGVIPRVEIDSEECKGCKYCIDLCPVDVLSVSGKFNHRGFHFAIYSGEGCTGCGVCFYACPEPGAITVYKPDKKKKKAAASSKAEPESETAAKR